MKTLRFSPHRMFAAGVALAGVAFVGFEAVGALPEAGEPGQGVSSFRLRNGMGLIVVVAPELRLAAVNLTAAVGSIDDPPEQSGMAHLLEHVTLGGSVSLGSLDPEAEARALARLDDTDATLRDARRRKADEAVLRELEASFESAAREARALGEDGEILGGRLEARGGIGLNATTGSDVTQYFGWIPTTELEYWLTLEADRLKHPIFRRFYSEREVVLSEIQVLTQGRPSIQDRLMSELFPAGPQAQPLAGDPKETRDIDRPMALAAFFRWYRPENLVLTVVANIDPAACHALAERTLGSWQPAGGQAPASIPEALPAVEAGGVLVRKFNSTKAPIVYFVFPRPRTSDREDAALEVIAEWLNSAELSPLYARLVEEKALAWEVAAEALYPSRKRPSAFLLRVSGNPGIDHELLIRESTSVLTSLALASREDLQGAMLLAEMRLAGSLDDPPTLAALLGASQAVEGRWDAPFRRLRELRQLEADDLLSTLGRVLRLAEADATPAGGGSP